MFIYLIVNHETGKYYVGQHKGTNLKKYLQQKFHHAQRGISNNSRLYRSMRAHSDPFLWSIHAIRSDIQTREELDQTEKEFIAFFKATDPEYGYNICRGGEGFTGPHSKETLAKLSELRQQMWSDPQFRVKRAESLKKAMANPEYHVSLSNGQQRRWASPQLRMEKSEEMVQSWADPEARDKKTKALKAAWSDPQVRDNHIKALSEPQTLIKMSEAMRKVWATPEIRARMTEANGKRGVESRLKTSEAQ